MDFETYIKMLLEKAEDPEEIAKREAYYAEKRKSFIFSIQYGDHFGSSCYRMIFKEEICRREFLDIMEKAKASGNCYADISDQSFRDENGILEVEYLKPDFQGYIDEYRLFKRYDSETDNRKF